MTSEVGRRLIDGALAFAAGDYARAVDAILPVRNDAVRIGGSHAQRDIINLTLIAAAERSGQWSLARALLAERGRIRPTSIDARRADDRVNGTLTAMRLRRQTRFISDFTSSLAYAEPGRVAPMPHRRKMEIKGAELHRRRLVAELPDCVKEGSTRTLYFDSIGTAWA